MPVSRRRLLRLEATWFRNTVRLALVLALPLALGGFTSIEALFAPKAELWPRWQAHDASSTRHLDHSAWSRFLAHYVSPGPDGINRVAYGRVDAEEKRKLDAYIADLAAQSVSALSRPEQLAYWVNLYNALTVRLILDHPEVGSIRDIDISPGLFADGPWGKKLVEIEGAAVGLNDIEHRILRPIWRDPRIHYAVNCAALGCPDLQRQAFTAGNAEALLEAAARTYVNHPRGAAVADGALIVSSIYIWFQEDFGGTDAGVIAHLRAYAGPRLATDLATVKRISGHAYDWSLNEAAKAAALSRPDQRLAER